MNALEYRYTVDAVGRIRSAAGELWRPTGSMVLGGVQSTTWLGPFAPDERDLIRVMAAVLDADRLSPRRPTNCGGPERELAWQRTIQVTIAVEDPARWTAASEDLSRLLAFMTDDSWELAFERAERPPAQQLLAPEVAEGPVEVALFSGGLDSAAGLLARSATTKSRFIAVSACGNDVRGAAQSDALKKLRELGAKADWVKFVHQLRGTRRSRSQMESSQRSRGLLFLAMGAVVASKLRVAAFSIYETGVGCINLPTSPAQVGAQGTRAMHPRTLALFEDLLPHVVDRPVRVRAPFFLHTKGELCREAGVALPSLAECTMSCDEGEGHKARAMEHCGLCTSCLFRRIALFSATSEPDATSYRDVATRRHGRYELEVFSSHASQLLACGSFADLIAIDPDVRFARRLPMDGNLSRQETEARVLDLYRRYAREISTFLAHARPTIAHRSRERRKENDGDLFAKAG